MQLRDRTTRWGHGRHSGSLWLALDAGRSALRVLGLFLALLFCLALLLRAGDPARGQGIQIDVQQCDEPNADPATCQNSSQQVGGQGIAPQPAAPRPRPRPTAPAPSRPSRPRPAPGTEVQTFDLATGQGQVETADGTQGVNLDLTVSPVPLDRPKVDPQTKPDVSTTGGALPSAGASNPFDFVSSDVALSQFAVPPFLVPIYVAAGRAYGVPWNVLAAINQIETDFGRNLNVSTAGALGWMQFMPSTWDSYGVDASGDGVADPYNPVDAIYAAARYLKASGAKDDLRSAIFSYNHADWYVDIVLKNAGVYGSLPEGLVAETGSLAFGRFPLRGRVSYGDDFRRAQIARRAPQGLWIDGKPAARAIATQNVTVKRVLLDRTLVAALRRNGELPSHGLTRPLVGRTGPPPSPARVREAVVTLDAAAGRLGALTRALAGLRAQRSAPLAVSVARALRGVGKLDDAPQIPGLPKGYGVGTVPGVTVEVTDLVGNTYGYAGLDRLSGKVRPGTHLRGGQFIGRLPDDAKAALLFSTRAAGGALVDPRPLVDGYRLQEAADFFHAVAPLGGSPFVRSADRLAAAGIKGGSERQLAQRVLSDPGIEIYEGGRQDIAQGKIDRRVLGALLYLRSAGMTIGVSCLKSGHSFYTSGGGVSAHSFGAAVDIWSFNGQPVIGNQGPGSLTAQAIRLLMKLQGAAQPRQLISLMSFGGPSFAMGDHDDHLHVGYSFDQSLGLGRSGDAVGRADFSAAGIDALTPARVGRDIEQRLSRRLGGIEHPSLLRRRGPGSVPVRQRDEHTEYPNERATAARTDVRQDPLRLQATAAGAQVGDIDVPAGAQGDEAYAIGTVDGVARGWAHRQAVVLAHRQGRWRLVGPPRDARGKIVNPRLRALSTVRGGEGFAVGDKGAVVALHGAGAPTLQPRATAAKLLSVDVARHGATGFAAGARGTILRLGAGRPGVESAGAGNLRDVAVTGGRALAVGSGPGDTAALYERSGGGWNAVDPAVKAPADATLNLAAVAMRGGQVWVAGGRVDGRTAGAAAEQPFAARLSGGRWTTYCSVPAALVAVAELGTPTTHSGCDQDLTPDPADSGAATGVAVTAAGVVIATSRGPQLLTPGGESFRPVPGVTGAVSNPAERLGSASLALTRQGEGWAFDAQGRMARVVPSSSGGDASVGMLGDWQNLPWTARGKPAAVAVASGGDRALAFGGGGAAVFNQGRWAPAGGFGFGLRKVAWAGDGRIVGLTEGGDLLRRDGSAWEIDGTPEARGLGSRLEQLAKLGQALGPEELVPGSDAGRAGAGFHDLAFAGADEGYAVGAAGAIERFDGETWKPESSNATEDLEAVAAGPGGAIAAGAHGTLLRRTDHGWRAEPDVPRLVGGQPFTAAAALPDGSFLATAGGAIVTAKGDGAWKAADVAPLAQDVERLSGYRDLAGDLHVLVLVNTGADKVLLDGDRRGWKPVAAPADFRVIDAQLSAEGAGLWVVASRSPPASSPPPERCRAAATSCPASPSPRSRRRNADARAPGGAGAGRRRRGVPACSGDRRRGGAGVARRGGRGPGHRDLQRRGPRRRDDRRRGHRGRPGRRLPPRGGRVAARRTGDRRGRPGGRRAGRRGRRGRRGVGRRRHGLGAAARLPGAPVHARGGDASRLGRRDRARHRARAVGDVLRRRGLDRRRGGQAVADHRRRRERDRGGRSRRRWGQRRRTARRQGPGGNQRRGDRPADLRRGERPGRPCGRARAGRPGQLRPGGPLRRRDVRAGAGGRPVRLLAARRTDLEAREPGRPRRGPGHPGRRVDRLRGRRAGRPHRRRRVRLAPLPGRGLDARARVGRSHQRRRRRGRGGRLGRGRPGRRQALLGGDRARVHDGLRGRRRRRRRLRRQWFRRQRLRLRLRRRRRRRRRPRPRPRPRPWRWRQRHRWLRRRRLRQRVRDRLRLQPVHDRRPAPGRGRPDHLRRRAQPPGAPAACRAPARPPPRPARPRRRRPPARCPGHQLPPARARAGVDRRQARPGRRRERHQPRHAGRPAPGDPALRRRRPHRTSNRRQAAARPQGEPGNQRRKRRCLRRSGLNGSSSWRRRSGSASGSSPG
jgi:hypothetical protein